jgi:hypothetical protein
MRSKIAFQEEKIMSEFYILQIYQELKLDSIELDLSLLTHT